MPTNPMPLVFGTFYHIYNRGNNHESIFLQARNYSYFMRLWWKHTSRIAETYAYCILKNHFHAAVFVKYEEDLTGFKESSSDSGCGPFSGRNGKEADKNLSGLKQPSQYFANFFNAYARGVNIATGRSGALFERPFERLPVTNDRYLMQLIVYIHQNPQKHKFIEDFRDWNYSSYHDLVGNAPTRLQRTRSSSYLGAGKIL